MNEDDLAMLFLQNIPKSISTIPNQNQQSTQQTFFQTSTQNYDQIQPQDQQQLQIPNSTQENLKKLIEEIPFPQDDFSITSCSHSATSNPTPQKHFFNKEQQSQLYQQKNARNQENQLNFSVFEQQQQSQIGTKRQNNLDYQENYQNTNYNFENSEQKLQEQNEKVTLSPNINKIKNWSQMHVTPADNRNIFPSITAPSMEMSNEKHKIYQEFSVQPTEENNIQVNLQNLTQDQVSVKIQVQALKQQNKELTNNLKISYEVKSKLEQEANQLLQKIDDLEEQLDLFKAKYQLSEGDLDLQKLRGNSLNQCKVSLAQLKKQIFEKDQTIAFLSQQIQCHQQNEVFIEQEIQKEMSQMQLENQKINVIQNTLRKNLAEKDKQILQIQNSFSNKTQELRRQIEQLQNATKELSQNNQNLQIQVQEKDEQIHYINEEIQSHKDTISQYQTKEVQLIEQFNEMKQNENMLFSNQNYDQEKANERKLQENSYQMEIQKLQNQNLKSKAIIQDLQQKIQDNNKNNQVLKNCNHVELLEKFISQNYQLDKQITNLESSQKFMYLINFLHENSQQNNAEYKFYQASLESSQIQSKNEELQKSLKKQQEINQQNYQQIQQSEKQINILQEELKIKQQQIVSQKQNSSQTDKSKFELQSQQNILKDQLFKLQKEMQKSVQEQSRLVEQNEQFKCLVNQMKQEKLENSKKIDELMQKIQTVSIEHETIKLQSSQEIIQLRKQLQEKNQTNYEVVSQQQKLSQAQNNLNMKQAEADNLKKQLLKVNTEKKAIFVTRDKLQAENNQLKVTINELQQQVDIHEEQSQQQQNIQNNEILQQMQDQIALLNNQLKEKEQEQQLIELELKNQFENQIIANEEQLQQKDEIIAQLTNEIKDKIVKLNQLIAEKQNLQNKLEELKKQNSNLKIDIDKQIKQLNQQSMEIVQIDQKIFEYDQTIHNYQNEEQERNQEVLMLEVFYFFSHFSIRIVWKIL